MRVKIATVVLVLIGLISIYQPIKLNLIHPSPENEELVVLDRAECVKDMLPDGVHLYGSLPAVDLIIDPAESAFVTGNQLRRLFLMRYAVTPKLVTENSDAPWVIGYFPNYESGLQYLNENQEEAWEIIKDCQNGVFLLKHSQK